LRDRWKQQRVNQLAPRAYRALDAYLTRAEQLWRGGHDPETAGELTTRLRDILAAAKPAMPDGPLTRGYRPRSLASLSMSDESKTSVKTAVTRLRELFLELKGIPPKEQEPLKKKFRESDAWKSLSPALQAKAVFQAALTEPPDKDRVADLDSSLPRDFSATYAETMLLRRLRTDEAQTGNGAVSRQRWQPDKFARLLEAVSEEERAVAGSPAALVRFRATLDQLAARRREGELLLVKEDWAASESVLTSVREAARDIADRVEMFDNARTELDDASVFLPACAGYVASQPDGNWTAPWDEAVQSSVSLFTLLNLDEPPSAALLAAPLAKLQDSLRELRRPFEPSRLKELAKRAADTDESATSTRNDLAEISRLLDSPVPDAESRESLATAVPVLADHLFNSVKGDGDLRSPAGNQSAETRRSKVSAGLLRLAGAEGPDEQAFHSIKAKLAREGGPVAARLSIALHPFEDDRWDALTEAPDRSAAKLIEAHKQWLRRRYLNEADFYVPNDRNPYRHEPSAEFFRKVAAQYE
jgi:hypothetical protein